MMDISKTGMTYLGLRMFYFDNDNTKYKKVSSEWRAIIYLCKYVDKLQEG